MSAFDRGVAQEPAGDGRYTVLIDPEWSAQAGPNGGYLAALLVRAVETALGSAVDGGTPPVRGITVHYLQPAEAAPAEVMVELTKVGRSVSFAQARLSQDGRVICTALVTAGAGRGALPFQDVVPPADVPPADALAPPPAPPPWMPRAEIAARFDYRPADASLAMLAGGPNEFWCWLRLRDARPLDAAALVLFTDAMIPAMFFRSTTPAVFPTVDLTVHLRATPRPAYDGWCLGHVRTTTVAAGFAEEDCEIYDDAGVLLAQSRQLSLVIPIG